MNYRYHQGLGVIKDTETACYYGALAAAVSSTEFSRVGGQPILESDRITDSTEKQIEIGNKG